MVKKEKHSNLDYQLQAPTENSFLASMNEVVPIELDFFHQSEATLSDLCVVSSTLAFD